MSENTDRNLRIEAATIAATVFDLAANDATFVQLSDDIYRFLKDGKVSD